MSIRLDTSVDLHNAIYRASSPTGPQPLRDDRLISAALIAEADKLLRDGRLLLGRAHSIISASYDPLSNPPGEYYDPLEDLPDW